MDILQDREKLQDIQNGNSVIEPVLKLNVICGHVTLDKRNVSLGEQLNYLLPG